MIFSMFGVKPEWFVNAIADKQVFTVFAGKFGRPKWCFGPPCVPPKQKCFWFIRVLSMHYVNDRQRFSLCLVEELWVLGNDSDFKLPPFSQRNSVGPNDVSAHRVLHPKNFFNPYQTVVVSALYEWSTMTFSMSVGQTGINCQCNSRQAILRCIRREIR